jgi:hypothetical protein
MRYSKFTAPVKKGKRQETNQLSIVIPAAGTGRRMKSYGPKCLLRSKGDMSIIEQIVDNALNVYPLADIIVVVGFEADKVIQILSSTTRIIENQLYNDTNVVESIRLALNSIITDSALFIYGDLIFNVETIYNIADDKSCAIVDSKNSFKSEEIGVTVVDNKITNFAYGLETKWAQIIFLTGKELKIFRELCFDRKRNKMYPFEIFNLVIDRGGVIEATEPKEMQIKEVDSLKDL